MTTTKFRSGAGSSDSPCSSMPSLFGALSHREGRIPPSCGDGELEALITLCLSTLQCICSGMGQNANRVGTRLNPPGQKCHRATCRIAPAPVSTPAPALRARLAFCSCGLRRGEQQTGGNADCQRGWLGDKWSPDTSLGRSNGGTRNGFLRRLSQSSASL